MPLELIHAVYLSVSTFTSFSGADTTAGVLLCNDAVLGGALASPGAACRAAAGAGCTGIVCDELYTIHTVIMMAMRTKPMIDCLSIKVRKTLTW
jgi:hypothetical protein